MTKEIKIKTIIKSSNHSEEVKIDQIANYQNHDLWFETIPGLLSQILFNLILNSSQALIEMKEERTEKAMITISIFQNEDSLDISVIDNGPGIDSNLHDNIFNPFITTKEKGTGLGLAISSFLTTKINGKLEFDPNCKQGSIFKLILKQKGNSY